MVLQINKQDYQMTTKVKIQLAITIFFGLFFLGVGIYQWYDLHQIEQGLKEGSLSIILHKIYEMAGKWGVALVYVPFATYCFWRAYVIFRNHKNENEYSEYEHENKELEDE